MNISCRPESENTLYMYCMFSIHIFKHRYAENYMLKMQAK